MTLLALQDVVDLVERLATTWLRRDPSEDPGVVVRSATGPAYRQLAAKLTGQLAGCAPEVVAVELGEVHEAMLELRPEWDGRRVHLLSGGTSRKATGSYFTPPALVEHLLDEALEPALADAEAAGGVDGLLGVKVLDPACGAGIFLVAAAGRIAHRLAHGRSAAPTATDLRRARLDVLTHCVYGVDRDAAVLELARIALEHQADQPGAQPVLRLLVADALLDDWPLQLPEVFVDRAGFDVVVGNPPFLNQLETLTAHRPGTAAALGARSGSTLRPYTDLSAVFLQRAPAWVRPGGRVALVQPQSLLAARDAGAVRADLAAGNALDSLWAAEHPVFAAQVLTCAPVLRRAAPQGAVRRTHGPEFTPLPPYPAPDLSREWSFLLAAGLGVPEVPLPGEHGTLGDLARSTADFRDQYYGLSPYVHEAADCPAGVPLVTTGLIEPAACLWGRRTTRFSKRSWAAPVVDLDGLSADAGLARWAAARMVPKVLLATQGKVLEAVADVEGAWLPSVPTLTVAAPVDVLWHVLAVLLAPPVAAHAAARYAGTALTMRAIKLSARQVAALPLPVDRSAWDRGAELAREAQLGSGDRPDLRVFGAAMCAAYGVEDPDVLEWWVGRL